MLPADHRRRAVSPITAAFQKQYSLFVHILPDIDRQTFYSAVNFQVGLQDPYMYPGWIFGGEANATVMAASLAVFLCPSDGAEGDDGQTGGTNYRANLGSDRFYLYGMSGYGGNANAGPFGTLFEVGPTCTPASISDGLSTTAALCEKLRGRVSATRLDPRTDMVVDAETRFGLPYSVDVAVASCASIRGTPEGFFPFAGLSWFVGSLSQSCYNHMVEPNSAVVDCSARGFNPTFGLFGARSNHPGGVNVGMADGSTRFVSTSIDRAVWRAIGTRSGSEVVGADQF